MASFSNKKPLNPRPEPPIKEDKAAVDNSKTSSSAKQKSNDPKENIISGKRK